MTLQKTLTVFQKTIAVFLICLSAYFVYILGGTLFLGILENMPQLNNAFILIVMLMSVISFIVSIILLIAHMVFKQPSKKLELTLLALLTINVFALICIPKEIYMFLRYLFLSRITFGFSFAVDIMPYLFSPMIYAFCVIAFLCILLSVLLSEKKADKIRDNTLS